MVLEALGWNMQTCMKPTIAISAATLKQCALMLASEFSVCWAVLLQSQSPLRSFCRLPRSLWDRLTKIVSVIYFPSYMLLNTKSRACFKIVFLSGLIRIEVQACRDPRGDDVKLKGSLRRSHSLSCYLITADIVSLRVSLTCKFSLKSIDWGIVLSEEHEVMYSTSRLPAIVLLVQFNESTKYRFPGQYPVIGTEDDSKQLQRPLGMIEGMCLGTSHYQFPFVEMKTGEWVH